MSSSSNENSVRLPTLDEIKKLQKDKKNKLDMLSFKNEGSSAEVSAIIEQANEQAKKIIDEALASADEQAQQLITQAQIDCQELYESTTKKAYDDAQVKAYEEMTLTLSALDAGYKHAIMRLGAQGDELFNQLRGHIIDTVLNIAHKILMTEFDKNDEVFFNMINAAIDSANASETIIIHVSPWEHKRFFLNNNFIDILKSNFPNIEVEKDNYLEKGCFEIVSGSTTLAAGVEKQMERLGFSLQYIKGN